MTAYARKFDGSRLNLHYAVANFEAQTANLISVTLTPDYDSSGAAASHAVYIEVSDGANKQSTNVACFMISDRVNEDFCRSYCQEQHLNSNSV